MIKLLLFTSLAFANGAKQQPTDGPFPIGSHPDGTGVVQCTSYPELGAPKDPNFKPENYPWPAVGGIKQNQKGPYACSFLLPDGNLTVGGGEYFYMTAGGSAKKLADGQLEQAKATRKNLSKGQKHAMLQIESGNPNWAYNLLANGVRFRSIPITSKCLLDRVVYKTKDGKFYYNNWYRYLGVEEADKGYIPTLFLKDYKNPDQLLAELKEVPGCLE